MSSRAVGVFFALILLAGGTGLHAQEASARERHRSGFWIGFGVGAARAHIDCTPCGPLLPDDPWEGGTGFGLYLAMGGAVRPDLLLGGELNLYGKRNSARERDVALSALSAVAQLYPLPSSGLFFKAGAGLGGSTLAGGPGLVESDGWAVQAGAGHDVRPGRRFALAPFVTFVQVFSAGGPGRNQGEPARGPRNPRYVQLGVGFHRY